MEWRFVLYRAIQTGQIAVIPMDLTDDIESFSLVNVCLDCFKNSVAFLQNPGSATDVAACTAQAPPNTMPPSHPSSDTPAPVAIRDIPTPHTG